MIKKRAAAPQGETITIREKRKKIVKKITGVIGAICVLLVAAVFVSVLADVIGGRPPSVFGYRLYFVLTDSMTPELNVNDVILAKALRSPEDVKSKVKIGDTVTFIGTTGTQKGLTITHKVVGESYLDETLGKEAILTRGVKTGAPVDPPVPLENVQALMVKKLPVLGSFYQFIMTGAGLALAVILPLVLMLGVLVYRLAMTLAKKSNQTAAPQKEKTQAEREAEIKKKAVEEYLLQKKKEEDGGTPESK